MKLFVKISALFLLFFFFFFEKRSEQGCFEALYTGSALFHSVRVEDGETSKGLLSFIFLLFCLLLFFAAKKLRSFTPIHINSI